VSAKVLQLEGLTIDSAKAAMATGEITATSLTESHYERISSKDPEINSFLALCRERALSQAEKVDGMDGSGG
jgi:aspartyl-tRNA(Asn)/glutamyl-tRNA(Gln) amidotransferase subunit A